MIICNISNNIAASFSEVGKLYNVPSLNVSHGTIAEAFNDHDKLYKKIIAEGVFSGAFTYFSLQSKITKKSIKTHQPKGKLLETSNLIFAENNKKKNNNNKILYPVTMKNFESIQYLGVEMFYEFYENLKTFEEISQKNEFKFLVKIHPSEQKCAAQLQSFFKNLEFTSKKIDHALRDAFVTISYSSTVIEDSLNSSVPVILFDQWNRYQHCEAERNIQKLNKAIYYVKKKEDLAKTLKTVLRSKKIDFKQYILDKDYNSNIKKFILPKAELKI